MQVVEELMDTTREIIQAATSGDTYKVQELIAGNAHLVNVYGDDGWTPLHLVAYFGHRQVAEVLLASGANVHARSRNTLVNMPLHAAVAGKREDLVEILVSQGADVNAVQEGGWTPLHEAADRGHLELVQILIEHGAFINPRKDDGETPRAIAARKGHKDVADYLRHLGGVE